LTVVLWAADRPSEARAASSGVAAASPAGVTQ
jgi:hypothetical protein